MRRDKPRSGLYQLEAYKLTNPWVIWSLSTGRLTEFCQYCAGRGFTVRRPCDCTEAGPLACKPRCVRTRGCQHCRRKCGACKGRMLVPSAIHPEDFGDAQSRALAEAVFDVAVIPRLRIDMEAEALHLPSSREDDEIGHAPT